MRYLSLAKLHILACQYSQSQILGKIASVRCFDNSEWGQTETIDLIIFQVKIPYSVPLMPMILSKKTHKRMFFAVFHFQTAISNLQFAVF
jgi:hypothetical protein